MSRLIVSGTAGLPVATTGYTTAPVTTSVVGGNVVYGGASVVRPAGVVGAQVVQAPQVVQQVVQQPAVSTVVQQPATVTEVVQSPVATQVVQAPVATQVVAPVASQVVQPAVATQVVGTQAVVSQPQVIQSTGQAYGVVRGNAVVGTTEVPSSVGIQTGGSRVEYIPFEKSFTQYDTVQKISYIPHEKRQTEYVPIEYQTENIPYIYTDKYVDYAPQERVEQRVEYLPQERQVVHPPSEKQVVAVEGTTASQIVGAPALAGTTNVVASNVVGGTVVGGTQVVGTQVVAPTTQVVERVVGAPGISTSRVQVVNQPAVATVGVPNTLQYSTVIPQTNVVQTL